MIRIEFVPRDMWLGLYWKTDFIYGGSDSSKNRQHVYICLLPMFPIHIAWSWTTVHKRRDDGL